MVIAVGRELYELFFQGYTRKQWGIDPSRARQVGDRAHPDPDQHRRPLFHRQASRPCRGTATRRCSERMLDHPRIEVRARRRLPRRARRGRGRPYHLHRADRRIFRLPLRQAALPEPDVRAQDAGRRSGIQPVGDGQLSATRRALHADQRVQAPDRPAGTGDDASPTNIRRPRAILIIRSRGRRTRRCSSATRRSRTRPRA